MFGIVQSKSLVMFYPHFVIYDNFVESMPHFCGRGEVSHVSYITPSFRSISFRLSPVLFLLHLQSLGSGFKFWLSVHGRVS